MQPLSHVLQATPPLALHGETDIPVTLVTQDSRRVTPGACFVAVPGFTVDGHDFLPQAIAAGATTLAVQSDRRPHWQPLLDAPRPTNEALTIVEFDDTRAALSGLAAAFHDFPARKLTVVGVTGTDGKSTTCYLTSSLLEAAGHSTGLIGGVQFKIAREWRMNTITETSPEADLTQALLAEMVDAGCTHAVIESTSHGLALHRLDHCEFDVGVFTGLSDDHLDFHRTRERYLDAKLNLFRFLDTAPVKDFRTGLPKYAVLLGNDPHRQAVAAAAGAAHLVTAGPLPDGDVPGADDSTGDDVSCSDLDLRPDGSRFRLVTPSGALAVQLALPARFNVANALLAAGAAWALDVGPVAMQRGLRALLGVPGRMEPIDEGQPFAVVVDAAATTAAFRLVLQSVRPLVEGRLIVVFGVAGERDPSRREGMGAAAAEFADFTVLTSENPRSEDPAAIVRDIAAAMERAGKRAGRHFQEQPDRRAAIARAFEIAGPGDYVLIAGKGAEQSLIFADHQQPWDDRTVGPRTPRWRGWFVLSARFRSS